jgi:predicted DNA-binding transcriptional regulator YafY
MQERNYRLDSIMDCALSDVSYEQSDKLPEPPANFSFKMQTRNLFLIEKYAALFQSIENIDGDYIASGIIGNAEWLQRLVISNAPDLRLLEPASLAVLIKERVNSAIDLY